MNDVVTLTRAEHQELLDCIVELQEELEAARCVIPAPDPETLLPAEVAYRMIEREESASRAWRKYRGLTLAQLAEKAGISVSYLSDLESGKRSGSIETLRTLAAALECSLPALID